MFSRSFTPLSSLQRTLFPATKNLCHSIVPTLYVAGIVPRTSYYPSFSEGFVFDSLFVLLKPVYKSARTSSNFLDLDQHSPSTSHSLPSPISANFDTSWVIRRSKAFGLDFPHPLHHTALSVCQNAFFPRNCLDGTFGTGFPRKCSHLDRAAHAH